MIVNRDEYLDLRKRIKQLTTEEQMLLVESILSGIRRAHFVDHEAHGRALDELIADPEYQKVLNNQDLPYPEPKPEAVREAG